MDTATRVRELVEPLVAEAGAALYDLEFSGGVLRITVDRDGGIDIDAIGRITRAVSRQLDEQDPIAGHYTLEVSSPGLERPLRTPEHFAGAVGATVSIKTRPGVEGPRRVTGVLVAADDRSATVALADDEPGATRVLALDDIDKARTTFAWGPSPKPGSSPRSGAARTAQSSDQKAAKS